MAIVDLARRWGALAALGLAASGCTDDPSARLVAGASTEADVRVSLGRPEIVWESADGSRELQYVNRPGGVGNLLVVIGPDGRFRESQAAFDPARLVHIGVGWQRDDLRRWLGQPTERAFYSLSGRTLWRWRYRDPAGTAMWYEATFDADGRLQDAESVADGPAGAAI
ncbi:MAG: hypothetical protein R3E87_00955 [Burkholderiaceae bacterium]